MATILIVDDDRSIVKMVQLLLTQAGHNVLTAMDGPAGLRAAEESRPDLIVLDVMMPGLDGFSVSGTLFQDFALRQIPILILTAKGSSREILSLVPNVTAQMEKPFDGKDLLAQVTRILSDRKKAA